MLKDFFKLNGTTGTFKTQDELLTHLKRSNNLKNTIYKPAVLDHIEPANKLRNNSFTNVSFSKTTFRSLIFRNCQFEDCLFIGVIFEDCEFHDCSFIGCNPYKAKFVRTYIDPAVFKSMLDPSSHSNIGVTLFQNLAVNSHERRQMEFANTAEYYFRVWKRYQLAYEYKEKQISWKTYLRKLIPDYSYFLFAGYGLRSLHFIIWTCLLFMLMTIINHKLWKSFAMKGQYGDYNEPEIVVSFYYTVVTLTTLGFGDITPTSSFGMLSAGIESLIGIIWLAVLASIIIKRIVR